MAVIVFVQCVVNTVSARIAVGLLTNDPVTPHSLYSVISFTYVGAALSATNALHYVSYPAQVLGKSAKPIPVMILGMILAGKRYPAAKFLFVVMITTGVALFMYRDEESNKNGGKVYGVGEVLLLLSLTFDGLTGGMQEKLIAEHTVEAHWMMYWTNLWSCGYLACLTIITGEGQEFVAFVHSYPYVMWQLAILSLCGAVGQHFIFVTIATFGPLTCSLITTTRKFFSILLSVTIFHHVLTSVQWLGTVFVFAGLLLDSLYGRKRRSHITRTA